MELSDAKQPGHSSVRAASLVAHTYSAYPCIEVRPLFQRDIYDTSLISFSLNYTNSQNRFAIGDFFVSYSFCHFHSPHF